MNIEDTKKAIEVMQAFVDGKEIQCRSHNHSHWKYANPDWNFTNCEYRVKPEPKEVWINMYPDRAFASVAWASEDDAKESKTVKELGCKPTLFREVIE